MYHVVDHPAAPFTTIAGDTKGPCVDLGVTTVHDAPIYIGQQETRSILKAFGWPSPEAYEGAVAERDAAVRKAALLAADLADARAQVATFQALIQIRQPEPAAKAEV